MKKGRLKIHATGFQTAFLPFTHGPKHQASPFFHNSAVFHHGVLTMARGTGHVVEDRFAHGAEAE